MSETNITLLIISILGYLFAFGCGYFLCKCRKTGLGTDTDLRGELNESFDRSEQSVADIEDGLTDITEQGKQALDIFRKYIDTTEKDTGIQQNSSGVSSSQPDFELHTDSAFMPIDEDDTNEIKEQ